MRLFALVIGFAILNMAATCSHRSGEHKKHHSNGSESLPNNSKKIG